MSISRSTLLTLASLLLAAGCGDKDDTATDDTETPEVDADGDGSPEGEDCDDDDATAYPGAPEACDGVDNDCNGAVDDGVGETWYADADGDTFGDPATGAQACEAPTGAVDNGEDCDDGDAEVFPGAVEVCDGVDNDCNDAVDDDAQDVQPFYADADLDGYGDAAVLLPACEAPEGYVADDTDCDDSDAGVNPGAVEVCSGVDEDCDTLVDLEDDSLDATSMVTAYVDADGDGFGAGEGVVTCLGEGYSGTDDDCDDDNAAINPDSEWYVDDDGDWYLASSAAVVVGCEITPIDTEQYFLVSTWSTALLGEDCDDADSEVFPYAFEELSNGIDDDCDGLADSADPGVPTTLTLADDESAAISLSSLSVDFCGTTYGAASSPIYMSSNGRIDFGGSNASLSESASSLLASTHPVIAASWDDLNPPFSSRSDATSYAEFGDAVAFYWREVPEYLRTGSNTFTVVVFSDGSWYRNAGTMSLVDSLVGWTCGNADSTTPATDLSEARAVDASAGFGQGTEEAIYERWISDYDLSGRAMFFCGANGDDLDGDGWTDACGDTDDSDSTVHP